MTTSTPCRTAADAIVAAFLPIPRPVLHQIGAELAEDGRPFLADLGRVLANGAFLIGSSFVRRAITAYIALAVDNGTARTVADDLGAGEPWGTVARALRFAADGGEPTPADRDKFYGVVDPRTIEVD